MSRRTHKHQSGEATKTSDQSQYDREEDVELPQMRLSFMKTTVSSESVSSSGSSA